ncbi:cupin domain-containing protein [Streptoalloteichus hindustanus]|uniref:Cupin domain-containing protein n=1 Tax=Streptoalloteichus hindustanus TaxID=2017 RepID=A0A1M5MTY4_STRHI|nr:cupin domain-containing protein [Streptoalloteichus hindustanus]SHG80824.1 Cupin domain-containing protein [Streptoalloteichus hindustanus]
MSPNTKATVVHSESAERVALSAGSAFHLLVDASGTGGALGANRLVLAEGADGARPHVHKLSTEMFSVLDGIAEFLLGDELITVGRGGLVVVPPGLPHAFGAAAGSTADLLVVMTPGIERFGYFRHLGRIAAGTDSFGNLTAEQERYDVHFTDAEKWQAARAR